MKKSEIQDMPHFFDRYINLAEDEDLLVSLEKTPLTDHDLEEKMQRLSDKTYAPDKWKVKDIVQHIIDNERIQAYRALRFARAYTNVLPGYDEQPFAQFAKATRRSLEGLLEEFSAVRQSTITLFKSFDNEMLQREGICYNVKISVLALGFVIVGHEIHHSNIIKERYLPLL